MLVSSEHEGELLLHDGVLAVLEDLHDELGVVQLKGESEGLRVSLELPEDAQSCHQQSRVLGLRHVRDAARQVEADAIVRSLIKVK